MKTLIFTIPLALISFSFQPSLLSPDEIMKHVNSRDEGNHVIQNFNMELVDRNNKKQLRETKIYRKDIKDDRKTIIVFTNPANVKGTAFMSYDYKPVSKEDDQWLYLPALRKTRRISAANRGDYFLGTDFTYEDIKLGSKMSESDYKRATLREEVVDGKKCLLVESIPVNEKVAKELGYSKVHQWIDPEIWFIRKSQYWDIAGNLVKTTTATDIRKIDGIWTLHNLVAENHKTGHKTFISFSKVDYKTVVSDDLFSEESLLRGVN